MSALTPVFRFDPYFLKFYSHALSNINILKIIIASLVEAMKNMCINVTFVNFNCSCVEFNYRAVKREC